jgi:hypothetical protein
VKCRVLWEILAGVLDHRTTNCGGATHNVSTCLATCDYTLPDDFCTVSTCYICTGIVGIHTFNSQFLFSVRSLVDQLLGFPYDSDYTLPDESYAGMLHNHQIAGGFDY